MEITITIKGALRTLSHVLNVLEQNAEQISALEEEVSTAGFSKALESATKKPTKANEPAKAKALEKPNAKTEEEIEEETKEDEGYTMKDIKAAVQKLVKVDKESVKAILDTFEVSTISQLPKHSFGQFMTKMNELAKLQKTTI